MFRDNYAYMMTVYHLVSVGLSRDLENNLQYFSYKLFYHTHHCIFLFNFMDLGPEWPLRAVYKLPTLPREYEVGSYKLTILLQKTFDVKKTTRIKKMMNGERCKNSKKLLMLQKVGY